jgi:hypothetical protein
MTLPSLRRKFAFKPSEPPPPGSPSSWPFYPAPPRRKEKARARIKRIARRTAAWRTGRARSSCLTESDTIGRSDLAHL